MSNHLHWIATAKEGVDLSDIIRDFKKFTSKKILHEIENNHHESRKKWLLTLLKNAGKYNHKNKNFKFQKDGNETKKIITNDFIEQKLNYIHQNPVRAEIVANAEDYYLARQ